MEHVEKANRLAKAFRSKASLPLAEHNEFSCTAARPQNYEIDFVPLRLRNAVRLLRNLADDSATGPDGFPARILRECAPHLRMPLVLLGRLMLKSQKWLQPWRVHWVVPLHKRGVKTDARNYRGVHLNPQLSKVAERLVSGSLPRFCVVPFVLWTGAVCLLQRARGERLACTQRFDLAHRIVLRSTAWSVHLRCIVGF